MIKTQITITLPGYESFIFAANSFGFVNVLPIRCLTQEPFSLADKAISLRKVTAI